MRLEADDVARVLLASMLFVWAYVLSGGLP